MYISNSSFFLCYHSLKKDLCNHELKGVVINISSVTGKMLCEAVPQKHEVNVLTLVTLAVGKCTSI